MDEILLRFNVGISNLGGYVLWIIIYSLSIRIIMSMFKTAAVRQGESDNEREKIKFSDRWGRIKTFLLLFFSCSNSSKLDDHWLPTIIGIFELSSYPIAMITDRWSFIGAWLGIKTVAQWDAWKKSRTPYTRFLVGNILSIFASFLLVRFVSLINN